MTSLLRKPNADKVFAKLLDSMSDFMGPTPRTVGVDLVSQVSSAKIQQSLDVKHVKRSNVDSSDDNRIKPVTKIDLDYTHPTQIWIRFYTLVPTLGLSVIQICPNVYELYIDKQSISGGKANSTAPTQQYAGYIGNMLKILETDYGASLIFCSEIVLFMDNTLNFLSNYLKFMWCTSANRSIFDPISHEDHERLSTYYTYGLMFVNTNNLTYMTKKTHGPTIAITGERPKVALQKFDPNEKLINEGSRANQCIDKPSDFGTVSNFIEIVSRFKLNTEPWIDLIV